MLEWMVMCHPSLPCQTLVSGVHENVVGWVRRQIAIYCLALDSEGHSRFEPVPVYLSRCLI